jgi:hypothetical protein
MRAHRARNLLSLPPSGPCKADRDDEDKIKKQNGAIDTERASMSVLGDRICKRAKVDPRAPSRDVKTNAASPPNLASSNATARSTMKRTTIAAPDFDLAMTIDSGQVFHWEKCGAGFVGTIGKEPIYAEQRDETLCASPGVEELVRNYFALDHPLAKICASFPDDPIMKAARSFCRGLRIIRQPKWECLATFICSSMKQMSTSGKFRQRCGGALVKGERLIITSCIHFRRRIKSLEVPRKNCENARWVIEPRIFS